MRSWTSAVGTLIIDEDGIYDPRLANDRLLLGMKGTFSEMELATFRQRSLQARQQKAERGEFYTLIPVGYVLTAGNRLEIDPDARVREAIRLVFTKFRELGSARQVILWMRQEGIELPTRQAGDFKRRHPLAAGGGWSSAVLDQPDLRRRLRLGTHTHGGSAARWQACRQEAACSADGLAGFDYRPPSRLHRLG